MKNLILSLLVAVGLIGSASASVIASYEFNGNAVDSSGNGYNGTVQGNASFVSDGLHIIGNASEGYQGGGFVSLPSFSGALNNNITLNIWAKGEQTPVFSEEDYFAIGVQGWVNNLRLGIAGSRILVGYEDTVHNAYFEKQCSSDSLNNWHMITLVMTPTTLSGYLNGDLFGAVNGDFLTPNASSYNAIGSHYWWGGGGHSARLTATLADASIYNNDLSAGDVANLYSIQGQNFGIIPEPSTYALFGLGAIGMLMVMRRKKTA